MPDKPRSTTKTIIIIITYTAILVMALVNIKDILTWLGKLLDILSPLFIALLLAYVINMPMRFIETKLMNHVIKNDTVKHKKIRRAVALAVTMILVFAIIPILFSVILPQVFESASKLIDNFWTYYEKLQNFADGITSKISFLNIDIFEEFEAWWRSSLTKFISYIEQLIPQILSGTKTFTTSVLNFIIGIVLCVYMLYNREMLLSQMKKLATAFLPRKARDKIYEVAYVANDIFSRFISGQFIEAIILSLLCFIGMSLLGIEYALLISVIVGFTNMIPYIGPFIGAVPSAFILLMINPIKALWFVIYIIILQQLESQLIYPKVVGRSVGLSGFWVLLSIAVGGGLFGVPGVFLGVPAFAVIYKLFGEYSTQRAEKNRQKYAEAGEPVDPPMPKETDEGRSVEVSALSEKIKKFFKGIKK